MTPPRRHPTSPYLLRRLRSYEEACAERQLSGDDGPRDAHGDPRRSRDPQPDSAEE